MSSKKPTGCWVVAGILVAAVVLMISGTIYGLVRLADHKKESHEKARAEQMAAEKAMLAKLEEESPVVMADHSGKLPSDEEPRLSMKEYLEFTHDSTLTSLARSAFNERADGATVDWKMKLVDVNEIDGGLQAWLQTDYVLQRGEGGEALKKHESLLVTVLFDDSSRGALLAMAKGDRVRFQGTLRVRGGSELVVEDARVITDDE